MDTKPNQQIVKGNKQPKTNKQKKLMKNGDCWALAEVCILLSAIIVSLLATQLVWLGQYFQNFGPDCHQNLLALSDRTFGNDVRIL